MLFIFYPWLIMTIALLLLAPQQVDQQPPIYFTELNGGLKVLDISDGTIQTITEFDRGWQNQTDYWASEVFSPDGRLLSYLSYRDELFYINVATVDPWSTHNVLANREVEYDTFALTWLPDNQYIIVTYLRFEADNLNQVYRELFKVETMELTSFLYSCSEIGINLQGNSGLLFRTYSFDAQLETETQPSLYYDFSLQQFASEVPVFDHRASIPECGQNGRGNGWDWSEADGLVVFDNRPDRRLYRFSPSAGEWAEISLDLAYVARLEWSTTRNRILISENLIEWQLIDLENSETPSVIDITSALSSLGGMPQTYCNDRLIYRVDTERNSVLHVVSLDTMSDLSFPLEGRLLTDSFDHSSC